MRPYEFDDDYSTILLGAKRSPGVVTLSGHDRHKNWNIPTSAGSKGANPTLRGDTPITFTASFYLVDDSADAFDSNSQFARWDEFRKLIESTTRGSKPFALPIYHPDLLENEITEVTNAGIGGKKHDGKGGFTIAVKLLEYNPRKSHKTATPTAKATAGPAAPPDPNAAAKAELASLVAQVKKP